MELDSAQDNVYNALGHRKCVLDSLHLIWGGGGAREHEFISLHSLWATLLQSVLAAAFVVARNKLGSRFSSSVCTLPSPKEGHTSCLFHDYRTGGLVRQFILANRFFETVFLLCQLAFLKSLLSSNSDSSFYGIATKLYESS